VTSTLVPSVRVGPLRAAPEVRSTDGGRVEAVAPVRADEPLFAGHYPGFPIFPGVCLLEYAHRTCLAAPPAAGLELAVVESVRFLAPTFPGDTLTVTVDWTERGGAWRAAAVVATERGEAARLRLSYRAGVAA
jgi:3-hydroxyacyl-[acyl-carrier-protein] dehydratase